MKNIALLLLIFAPMYAMELETPPITPPSSPRTQLQPPSIHVRREIEKASKRIETYRKYLVSQPNVEYDTTMNRKQNKLKYTEN